jgi:hypothetical protein
MQQAIEAERIIDPLWKANPDLHGNLVARILGMRALVAEARQQHGAACVFARRALAAAYDSVLKQGIEKDIDRLCSKS